MKIISSKFIGAIASLVLALLLGCVSACAAEAPKSFTVQVSGHGPPMILIPGLSCSGAVWNDTVAHFKDRYECHVLTLAGFAGQPRIPAPFLDTVRGDLAAYIRTNKLVKPVVVGHSLGGFMALWLASHDPDLVGPLVIVDSLPFLPAGMYPTATVETAKPYGEQMRAQMAAGGESYLQASQAAVDMMITKPKDRELVMTWLKASDPVAVGDGMYDMYTHDLRDDIAKIKSPTLVLGTWIAYKDFVTRDETESRIRGQYAKLNGCKIVMAETRHFIMLDDRPWFLGQVDAFLAKGK